MSTAIRVMAAFVQPAAPSAMTMNNTPKASLHLEKVRRMTDTEKIEAPATKKQVDDGVNLEKLPTSCLQCTGSKGK